LFIGTVQGVIQVLPLEADWIRLAGHFGEYIDPISHAHVNLVTGVTMSLAAFLVYFSVQLGGRAISKRNANLIFWVLAPGSLLFYLSFLFLGLILGGAANGYGGIQNPMLAALANRWRVPLLAFTGSWMLAGFWIFFITLWRSLGIRSLLVEIRRGSPKAFWLVSSLALVVGTFQGLLQIIPATAHIIDLPGEMPNIHAQLNMIGGVLLALMGLVVLMLPKLVGEQMDARLTRYGLYGVAGGIFGYYAVTMISGLVRYGYLQQGLNDGQTAAHLSWVIPATLMLTSLPMLLGYLSFGAALWRATEVFRAEWLDSLRHTPDKVNNYRWQHHFPMRYYLIAEFASSVAGFPGLGWLMSGRAFPGIPLLITGPVIAWAVMPFLFDPFANGALRMVGFVSVFFYLAGSSLLSVATLWLIIRRSRARSMRPA
jgi:hypothetical protein